MDPIFIMNSQNQRMLENTQRSSDGLRTNMMRERKEKAGVRKSHYIDDTAEFSSDLSDMGEDMLGGMDDLVGGGGGGGGAALFRKMWEEDVEEEDKKAAQRSADTLFDEGQSTCLIDSKVETSEESTPLGELPVPEHLEDNTSEEVAKESSQDEAASTNTSTKDVPNHDNLGVDAVIDLDNQREAALSEAMEREAKEAQAEEAASSASSLPAVSTESEAQAEHADRVVKIPTGSQGASLPAAEDVDLSQSQAEKQKTQSAEKHGSSFISSLLDNSEGFIFHEAVPEVVELSGRTSKGKREAEALKVPHELEKVLDQLIVCQAAPEAAESLRLLLSRFGKGVLDACMRDGLKVKLLSHKELKAAVYAADSSLQGREIGHGAYLAKERLCLIASELFSGSNQAEYVYGFHPALYYFGMAWDHALGEGTFASLQSPVIKANAQACQTNLEGHCAPDPMSCADPVNYFAQAVEAYFSANDCSETLWSREDLYDFDRLMYDYLEYLHLKSGKQA
ncbi:TPA: hypothetical protein DD394_07620 [bacterium UBP9_UBA11836]|nr:hypothetical protein [bacterium UBP9_UBA11836]